jgi:hypothetical protein
MIFYEVSVTVSAPMSKAFESYMRNKHIPEILATKCFTQIHFAQMGDNIYRTCYQAQSQADYERYISQFANTMRADFMQHFPDGCQVQRQVWNNLETWRLD